MDFGWTYYAGRNLRRICEKVSHIVELFTRKLEDDPRRRFTGLGTFANIGLIAARRPELLERIRSLVAEGRIDLPGHLVNMPNIGGAEFHLTPESLVRNLAEGRSLHRRLYGRSDSRVLHLPDVTGSFGNLPQLLRLAGYDCYRFDRGWHGGPEASTFRWRGIDGSEVIANRVNYCGSIPEADDQSGIERLHGELSRRAAAQGEPGVPVLHHLGHDLTEPDTEEVDFCEEWNRRYPDLPMEVSTYSGFFDEVRGHRRGLPVFEGTIDPLGWTATHGMGGYRARRVFGGLFDAIQELESYAALGSAPHAGGIASQAWQTGLAYQEHGASNFLLEEDSAEVYGDLARVRGEVDALREATLRLRAAEIAVGPGEGQAAVVFNPLPWLRREPVELEVSFAPTDSVTALEIRDAADRPVDFQVLAASEFPQGGLRSARLLWIAGVPPCGEAAYRIRPVDGGSLDVEVPREVEEWYCLENGALSAAFKYGLVRELRGPDGRSFCRGGMSERHGESLLSALGAISVLPAVSPDKQYNWGMMNRFGKPVSLMGFPFEMESTENGPVRTTVRVARRVDEDRVCCSYSMVAGGPQLDIGVGIETQRSGYRWEMAIPFVGLEPRWRRDEAFGVQDFDPETQKYVDVGEAMTPGGFFCQSFVDARFAGQRRGLTVLAPDHPGFVACGEVLHAALLLSAPLRLEDRTCRFSMSPETRSLGRFDYRYRLYSYDDAREHQPARRALEMRFPLRAARAFPSDRGRACRSMLEVAPGNIAWSAHYRVAGRGLLRLYECEGQATGASIRMPGVESLRPVDLLGGAAGDPIRGDGGNFAVSFGAFQIRTFEFAPPQPGTAGCASANAPVS